MTRRSEDHVKYTTFSTTGTSSLTSYGLTGNIFCAKLQLH